MKKKKILLIIVILVFAHFLFSARIPELRGRVNDYANILDGSQETQLTAMLKEAEETTSSQIVLLTINSLEGDSIESFSIRVAENWKIGQKEYDNGVLLVISMEERKLRIEVGYGLEPILTDLKCGYIIRNKIVPHFRKGNFYTGINDGLKTIIGIVNKDFDISQEELEKFKKQRSKQQAHFPIGIIIFILFIIFSILRSIGRGRRGSVFWGGGYSGGGGSSGGFSGGGGSFGGGGASGGW